MQYEKLNDRISPFYFMVFDDDPEEIWASLVLDQVGQYQQSIFESRADEGFEGNGYDWNSLALVFVEEKMPELKNKSNFDPESSMFCVQSSDIKALEEFALSFKAACEDREMMSDLLSRAQLD